MYQKCPLCKGKGVFKKETCPVCLGERIVAKDTGLPPSKYLPPNPWNQPLPWITYRTAPGTVPDPNYLITYDVNTSSITYSKPPFTYTN